MSRAALVIAAAAAAACGARGDDRAGKAGRAAGEGLAAAVEAAARLVAPWRCAALDEPVAAAAPAGWTRAGAWLRGEGARVLVVGEARDAAPRTVAALEALRRALDADPVDVVVSLGGIGTRRDAIARGLSPLAAGAPWLVVAVSGDREALLEHRAAVAELAAAGARIVDGSQIRAIELPGAVIGTLPGAPYPGRLAAGADGCAHDDADVAALLAALAGAPADPAPGRRRPATVLVSQRAPRGATDLAPGGIHAGDPELAAALAAHPVDLVIHGALDDRTGPAGATRPGRAAGNPGAAVAVGAIDATPRATADGVRVAPTALRLVVGERELAWRPVAPAVVP